ncbi:hypothetical protein D3C79_1016530 [compost metagenome]
MIGLDAAHGNDRIDSGLQCCADVEFKLAQLVAARADQHMVVAFEKQADTLLVEAQQLFESRSPLNGRGTLQQVCPRKNTQ